ncbi:hypothetical protein BASA50_003483 [Batrachochytrium salamandrivorans]|uniref:Uncharacterized protein n=1 Tax=Batrachochytrium salamandrivorans TaxID=1357716 RepID=A0ABQ8FHJ8_9FUNG|nr:hypothetical protein BASA50_003483 [Batrachochytrium salamandrivorans]KAH6599154.1 hypothetical protein BASA61_002685 [Batrachochytrium salamandrivorans]KAH9266867.1 hypothetical protein BASA84_000929 [Batrachochytrium salamandrivorans]
MDVVTVAAHVAASLQQAALCIYSGGNGTTATTTTTSTTTTSTTTTAAVDHSIASRLARSTALQCHDTRDSKNSNAALSSAVHDPAFSAVYPAATEGVPLTQWLDNVAQLAHNNYIELARSSVHLASHGLEHYTKTIDKACSLGGSQTTVQLHALSCVLHQSLATFLRTYRPKQSQAYYPQQQPSKLSLYTEYVVLRYRGTGHDNSKSNSNSNSSHNHHGSRTNADSNNAYLLLVYSAELPQYVKNISTFYRHVEHIAGLINASIPIKEILSSSFSIVHPASSHSSATYTASIDTIDTTATNRTSTNGASAIRTAVQSSQPGPVHLITPESLLKQQRNSTLSLSASPYRCESSDILATVVPITDIHQIRDLMSDLLRKGQSLVKQPNIRAAIPMTTVHMGCYQLTVPSSWSKIISAPQSVNGMHTSAWGVSDTSSSPRIALISCEPIMLQKPPQGETASLTQLAVQILSFMHGTLQVLYASAATMIPGLFRGTPTPSHQQKKEGSGSFCQSFIVELNHRIEYRTCFAMLSTVPEGRYAEAAMSIHFFIGVSFSVSGLKAAQKEIRQVVQSAIWDGPAYDPPTAPAIRTWFT